MILAEPPKERFNRALAKNFTIHHENCGKRFALEEVDAQHLSSSGNYLVFNCPICYKSHYTSTEKTKIVARLPRTNLEQWQATFLVLSSIILFMLCLNIFLMFV